MPTGGVNPIKVPLRVLIIEDYEEDALLLQRHLSRAGYDVHARRVQTADELLEAIDGVLGKPDNTTTFNQIEGDAS